MGSEMCIRDRYQVPHGQNPQQAQQELLRRVVNPQPNLPPITIY